MKRREMAWLALAALATVVPVHAVAQTPSTTPSTTQPEGSAFANPFSTPVAADTLSAHRGGSDLVRNNMTLNGTTTGNTATNVMSGSNVISAGAFASMSGMPLVIQNSGANVLIQNAVILHVQMN
jgi:hypothetical protein